jgi:hypothetical protein
MYTDYREKLRDIFFANYDKFHPKLPISNGIVFYDWCVELENQYRQSKGFSQKVLITDKAVYEYATSQLGITK